MRRSGLIAAVGTMLLGGLVAQKIYALGTEEFGNNPLNELNYAEWKGIVPIVNNTARVYHTWVNGSETFYFKGTTTQLNTALEQFAIVEVKNHVVVLSPGPAEQRTFHGKSLIHFNWELHIIGGIAKSRATDDIEDFERQKDPVLRVYIGGDIDLDHIQIPKRVTIRAAPRKSGEVQVNETEWQKIKTFVEQQTQKSRASK